MIGETVERLHAFLGEVIAASHFSPVGRSAERERGDEGGRVSSIEAAAPHPALRATFSPLGRRGGQPQLKTMMISTEFCL
ncbi:hypothetical protein ASD36_19810 [Rhizobium sp. Root1334]|nr:hypothetical protein ASC96_11640 [Rhizobium sp. Root1204]KQY01145.1 hypothetical protein ASD36_19810 [Rhizobium sp. Root1334]